MNDVIENNATLRNDVECILLECHRNRPGVFASDVTHELLAHLADRVARRVGPIIGGGWVTYSYAMGKAKKTERDLAVQAAFNGTNHVALMKRFSISRRLVYSILAQKRKSEGVHAIN